MNGMERYSFFLSSPSACRTSRASKNRDWRHENGTIFLCDFEIILLLLGLGSLGFLKGQTNSKWFFQANDSSKKQMNEFGFFLPKGAFIYYVRFLGRQVGQAASDFTKQAYVVNHLIRVGRQVKNTQKTSDVIYESSLSNLKKLAGASRQNVLELATLRY